MREVKEIPITGEIVFLDEPYDSQDDVDVLTEQFDHALLSMARTYTGHMEKKGHSWRLMTPEEVRLRLTDELREYTEAINCPEEEQELIDVLNVGLMLLSKLRNKSIGQ